MDNDAVLNCNDLGWISFMYLLGSSSVVKNHVFSDYLDIGEPDYKHSFNCNMTPRIIHILKKCFWYFIAIKKLLLLLYLENFNQILFIIVTYNPPHPPKKIYIYNPSHTSSNSKNIAWSNQNGNEATENEISHLDLTKVSNQNWKPNLLSQSTSSTVSSS